MTTMNASSLFMGSQTLPAYHKAISPCDKARAALVSADKKIRHTLRTAARRMTDEMTKHRVLASRRFIKDGGSELKFELRFLWQGSLAYDTAVDPAHKPPQQCDLDDGIYVRTSFFGHDNPAVASGKLFKFVESVLEPLCQKEGWTLVKNKNTCIRIELDKEKHIDLPLYAIPDDEFVVMSNAARRTFGENLNVNDRNLRWMMDEEKSLRIPHDRVMLAHRKLKWIPSDPRALHDWFEAKVEEFGPQLRRASRYFKGWRDFRFLSNGPESITLMVCVVLAYEEQDTLFEDDRDDAAILQIANKLPGYFASDIANPVLNDASKPLNDWSDDQRKQYIDAANGLIDLLTRALENNFDAHRTVDRLVEAFGDRVPVRPDLVKCCGVVKAAIAMPAVAAPLIQTKPTTSG